MKSAECRWKDWGPREPVRLAIERFREYGDDWRQGLHRKVFSAALLIFLTSVGPAMSFGEYLFNNLNGSYGVLEVLVTTALCGTIFSLISGSPLVIVGATGPFSIFGFNCYRLAQMYDVPFMPWMAWIMVISGLQHIVLGLIGASTKYLPSITSFSGQVFGVLVSMIYIVESCQNVAESFQQGSLLGRLDGAFFYSIIAFGQLAACMFLHAGRTWLIFNETVRDVIADYGPSLSIIAFTGFTLIPAFSSVSITRINIPSTFGTTSGRPWLVDFNDPGLTSAHKGLAFFPALVLTALYFFDHNVAALLTHRSEFKLKKQLCYDWDLMVLGFMIIICGVLGLPPCNGLIPNSPMHSKALKVYKTMDQLLQEDKKAFEASQKKSAQDLMETKTEEQLGAHVTNRRNSDTPKNCGLTPVTAPDSRLSDQFPEKFQRRISVDDPELLRRRGSNSVEDLELQRRRCSNSFEILESQRRRGSNSSVSERNKPELDHVVDQRLSNLMQSGMVAIMLLILPVVALVPTCVVTGLFLFMGVESLLDGDIYSRIILPFVEKRSRKFLDLGASVTPVWLNNNIKAVNVYTLIQLLAFGLVFYITQTVASIIFPVLILLLIPLRFRLLPRISLFNQKKEGEPDFFEVMDLPLIFDSADASAAAAAAPAEIPLVHIASADDAAANASPSAALGDTVGGGSRAGDASMNAHTASGDVIVSVPPIMLYPNLECIEASQC